MNLDKISKENLFMIITCLIRSNIEDNLKGVSIKYGIRDIIIPDNGKWRINELVNQFVNEIFDIHFPGWDKEETK
jgi:hypothetical protein